MPKQLGILLMVAGVLLAFFGIQACTCLVGLNRDAADKWARLEPGLVRRGEAALALAGALPGPAADAVVQAGAAWQAARTASDKVLAASQLDRAVAELEAAASAAAQDPARVPALRDALRDAGARIEIDRRRFDEAVFEYNACVQRRSAQLVRVLMGFPARWPALGGVASAPGPDQAPSPSNSAVDR